MFAYQGNEFPLTRKMDIYFKKVVILQTGYVECVLVAMVEKKLQGYAANKELRRYYSEIKQTSIECCENNLFIRRVVTKLCFVYLIKLLLK